MLKSIKYRSYPNARQEGLLAQMFGNQRFVWNHFLALQKERITDGQGILSEYEMKRDLKFLVREHSWLGESKVDALRISIEHLDCAFNRFFRQQAKFPKFKSRRDTRVAVTTPSPFGRMIQFGRKLEPVAISEHRPVPAGKRKRLTISRVPSGKYFTSLLVDTADSIPEPITVSGVIGIDEGLTDFVVLSTGRKIKHGKHYRANLYRLKREQRRLSRKTQGSNRRERQRIKVAKIHEKIANSRSFETHSISTNLVRKAVCESQAIAFQKTAIVNQMKNHNLAMSIADAGWGELRRQLAYKCSRAGIPLIEVDKWVPTTYPCNACGIKAQAKMLSSRTWTCGGCGARIDRDVNAARNIASIAWNQLRPGEARLLDAEGSGAVMPPYEASSEATRAIRAENIN